MKYLLLSFTILITACSTGITTNTDYRPETDFAAIETYQYLAFEDDGQAQTIYTNRIEQALKITLESKGLTPTQNDPDIIIAYHIFTETKEKQRVTTTGSVYFGRRYMGTSINMGTTYVDNIEYNVGHMIVDFIEPETRKVVWHGEAIAKIDMARNPDERTALIQEAVNDLLKDFPPTRK